MWQFFLFVAAVSAQQPHAVPFKTSLPKYANGVYFGTIDLEYRYPGMTFPIPIAVGISATYASDHHNQRWAWLMPQLDSLVYSLPTIRYDSRHDVCYKMNATFQEDIANELGSIKVAELPNHVDLYCGGSQTSDIGRSFAYKCYWLDSRDNRLIALDFLQKSGHPRNSDGSCSITNGQVYGKMIFQFFTPVEELPATGDGSMDSYFQVSSLCSPQSPDWNELMCFT